jgi:DUF971 family protein
MKPKKFEIVDKSKLKIIWADESENILPLKFMRDECPCAGCKGETILLRTIRPPKVELTLPDAYQIKGIEMVGGYAIQITWKDGHDTGIYSWDYIQTLIDVKGESEHQHYKPLI